MPDTDVAAESTPTDTLANVWPAVGAGVVPLFRLHTDAAKLCCCDVCETCVIQAPNLYSSLRLTDESTCDGEGTHIQVDQREALQLSVL